MIKMMNGVRQHWEYPVMEQEEVKAVQDEEKAEVLAKALVKIPGCDNLSEAGQGGRAAGHLIGKEKMTVNHLHYNSEMK